MNLWRTSIEAMYRSGVRLPGEAEGVPLAQAAIRRMLKSMMN